MRFKYRILQSTMLMAEGEGRDIPYDKRTLDKVIETEQNFERITGFRLHLELVDAKDEEASFDNLREVVESTPDLVPGVASTSLSNELHSTDLLDIAKTVAIIQAVNEVEVRYSPDPSPDPSPEQFAGGESGGGGASGGWDSGPSDTGSSSSDSGSSGSNE